MSEEKMPKKLELRQITEEERTALEQLKRSQTAEARMVERAKMILWYQEGQKPVDIAAKLDRTAATIYTRLKRFDAEGMAGMEDQPQGGRKPTYTESERGQLIALARTDPQKLGLPFRHWTLDRLVAYLRENDQVGISRAQLARVLKAEGLRWYQEQVYFTERPDPQFVEKRGP
jgi:transposase